ncbi:putative sperm motility kinase W [Grammomys surdaster]|uniref:putative sperm motility kinase W n=1 Tax=Grammomys surdaster TaxID=491861 RepID=UPI0010A06CFB|nr:putative sperm motility kinase W [Grammomys surdaster]
MASHMKENILEKDFRILLSLGCGSFGEVKLACHLPTRVRVAVKVLEKNINSVADITSEVELLQSLEHRNIVRFFHMVDTLTTTYVIMEYVAGEDLERCLRALGCLKEEEARPIFQQVVSAVHFLHQRHIAHRDIKLENILVDAAGNTKLCDFGMAIKITEGQMLEEICGSLLYWAPEILARKPYDGLAVDMWSLGIVLYVLVTGHFPYVEATAEDMHRIITTTMCPIPYHLSKPCHSIIARLLMVPTWYRMTIHQLVERPWLGHIQEHGLLATKEILPRVVNTMCTIGYTCEEIVSSLTHRRLKDEVMATFNILKYQLSCGDSHQQVEKPWANRSPVGALIPLPYLKRRASEPVFSTCTEAGKGHFQNEGMEGRGKNCRRYPMVTMETVPCSDDPVPEGDALTADITNTATGDIAVNRNSMDSLPSEHFSPVSAQDGTSTGFLNMGFYAEDPSSGPDISSDQPHIGLTASGSRILRSWELMRKRISCSLKGPCCCCCCCCCCLPSPR